MGDPPEDVGRLETRRRGGNRPRIWAVVRRIPRGKVASYGQVALWAGLPHGARQVGYALHDLPEGSGLPWHRVLNAQGRVSVHPDPVSSQLQRALLESEGVVFDARGRVDLGRWGWRPRPQKGRAP